MALLFLTALLPLGPCSSSIERARKLYFTASPDELRMGHFPSRAWFRTGREIFTVQPSTAAGPDAVDRAAARFSKLVSPTRRPCCTVSPAPVEMGQILTRV